MAALVVQSRFAGLKIEDDDYPSSSETQKKKPKAGAVKKVEPPKKKKDTKPQSGSKKKKQKGGAPTAEQWETWKQKDEELVDGHFESELHQAILLSKLDYEEKKDVYKQIKKDAEMEKRFSEQSKAGSKKQKKKYVMSLDQFNEMMSPEPRFDHLLERQPDEDDPPKDTAFFDRVEDETKHELIRDKIIDRVRNNRKSVSGEVITRVQFADALEKKDQEIAALKDEITSLKQELLTVKSRNKKLCNILGQGEMKDKAEVLVEVERLRGVQSELTDELAALHEDLERERSRHVDTRARDKKKKGASDKEK